MGRRAEPFTHSPAMKYIVALLACAASTLALADSEFKNVPPLLHKSIQHGGVTAAQFDGGVLRAQLNKAEVTELVYQTFVFHNICAREWYEPQQFASLGLARVELLNAKKVQIAPLITHRYGLDGVAEAIQKQTEADSLKVLVKP